MITPALEKLELNLHSDLPTERAPEKSAEAARAAVQALAAQDAWCDSEAPTGVETQRPLLPRPPRTPRV